jgi:anaerobic selenocysteine-containing dehydrogenase
MREELADESALEGARGFAPSSDAEGNVWPGLRSRIMTAYAPDRLEARTGLRAHGIEGLARELAAARPSLVAVDETAGDDATAAAGLVLNALLGNLDAPGGMILGGDPGLAELGKFVPDATAERGLRAGAIDGRRPDRSEFEASRILAVPEAILAGKPYPAKALLLHYSNPAYSKPGRERWKAAIARVPLVVSFSPLMDESVIFADMVLPDLGFLERWDVVLPGRGMRALSLRQPVVRPLGNAMQTGEVIVRLARALGDSVARAFPWRGFREAVRAGLAQMASGTGEVLTALESGGAWLAPSALAAPVEHEPGGAGHPRALRDVTCVLPAGWKQPEPAFVGDPARFPFVLVPFRGMGYGEGGMRHTPWLCELPVAAGDPWRQRIEISPADARTLGVADGDGVVVESPSAEVTMWARVHEGIRPGVLGLPMGGGAWPDAGAQADASSLLASLADEVTGHWLACATRARVRKGT